MEEMDFPEGWALTNLEGIITISSGKGLPKTKMVAGSVPVYGGNGITGMHNAPNVNEPTIVIGRVGFYCGSVHITPEEAWVTDNAFITSFNLKHLDKLFLYRLLTATNLRGDDSSTAQPVISGRKVYPVTVLLPPLPEQKVIAEKLDSLLAQVETTKARLDRVPDILKRFRQSVLVAAVSGRLTEEWRGIHSSEQVDIRAVANEMFESGLTHGNFGKKSDRAPDITQDELPLIVGHLEKWPLIRIGALCACVVPNRDKPKKFSGGYHWLLTPNFHEQSIWIDYSSIEKGLSEKEVNTYKAKVIKHGNVIMTCVGRLGLSAVLEEDAVINQQLHAFLVNDFIEPEYLAYCIRANTRFFEDKSTSTTVSYLNKTACNSLPIPLPTLEEQAEIIRRVEQLFTLADTIEQKAQAATERVNKLTQSILAKAFRGDLTKDWRAANPDLISGENSAEALLEKIKAEREAIKPKKKTRAKKEKA